MRRSFMFTETTIAVGAALIVLMALAPIASAQETAPTGSVIFIHPDGTGAASWNVLRDYYYGPDSLTNWDQLARMGIYRSHVLNSLNSSSHGGATIHSYGVKVEFDTYGSTSEKPVTSLSGKPYSIMTEAQKAGLGTALVNSGHICEPGTGVFVANSVERSNTDLISEQIVTSGVDVILSGGEVLLLPKGTVGRHGAEGVRKDGKNLIALAEKNGYTVVYTRDELMNLDPGVTKVLGVFSPKHTFNDDPEETLRAENLPLYNAYAPTLAEMTASALRILRRSGTPFLMVVEEEGTDNFANCNNARGTLEALKHTDDAIGVAMADVAAHPNTLIVTGADSEAGGLQIYGIRDSAKFDQPLPETTDNGAALDGIDGPNTVPFVAAPDKHGTRMRFGVAWACYGDVAGGVIARAHGLNAERLGANVDNTDIYRLMYATLFGRILPDYLSTVSSHQ